MTVRPSTADDAARIHEIERLCFSDPWGTEDIRRTAEAAYTHCLTATAEDGVPCGYVLTSVLSPEAEILRIATHPAYRRRGAAAALLQAFIAHARAEGVTHVYLEVRSAGEAARALYRAHGFCETGRRRAYYKNPTDDAVLMRLELS